MLFIHMCCFSRVVVFLNRNASPWRGGGEGEGFEQSSSRRTEAQNRAGWVPGARGTTGKAEAPAPGGGPSCPPGARSSPLCRAPGFHGVGQGRVHARQARPSHAHRRAPQKQQHACMCIHAETRALSMFSTMTLFTSLMSPLTRVMASAEGLLEKYSICWWSTRENSVLYA